MSAFEVVSLCFSAGAVWLAFRSYRHSVETRRREEQNRRGIDVLERKVLMFQVEQQEAAIAAREMADIRVTVEPGQGTEYARLRLDNYGAEARDVDVVIERFPREPQPIEDRRKLPLARLGPDGHAVLLVLLYESMKSFRHVTVTWVEPDGSPGKLETDFDFR